MDEAELTSSGRLLAVVLVILGLVALLAAIDLWGDLAAGTSWFHALTEGAIVLAGLLGTLVVGRRLLALRRAALEARREVTTLRERVRTTEVDAAHWRAEARTLMQGLSQKIDEQFDRWQLSPAEKEVGLLLLKGLSHKEIAATRSVTEATARQQARAVYRKGSLSGRYDLAAFFLEDLMLPPVAGSA